MSMILEPPALEMQGEDPLAEYAFNEDQLKTWHAHRESVRLQCVEEYSSNLLWQAKAAKDPQYWNNFYVGQVNLLVETS